MSITSENNEPLPGRGPEINPLGGKLLAENLITESQLQEALERQRVHGGRLGDNLIELGYLTLEAFTSFLRKHPAPPRTAEETGLGLAFIAELALRRIRYKIKIGHPTADEFETIFVRVCQAKGIPFDKEVFDFLREHCYRKHGVAPNACHPRDLIDFIIDDSRYYRRNPKLTKEIILEAWSNYFVEN